jgi:dihydrofolate synthase/folylpolyglutamate synthase
VAEVEWPARFEVLSRDPLLVVDGAHNVDSAQRLRQTLSDYFPGRDVTLIFGVSGDKDVEGMLGELLPGVRHVIVMQSSHPRAAPVEDLLSIVTKWGRQPHIAEDADRALDMAFGFSAPGDPICACGSLFVAADVRLAWFRRNKAGALPMTDARAVSVGEGI